MPIFLMHFPLPIQSKSYDVNTSQLIFLLYIFLNSWFNLFDGKVLPNPRYLHHAKQWHDELNWN